MNRDQIRHRNEAQVDRGPAGGAEGVDFFIPAVAGDLPMRHLAGDLHVGTLRKDQIGPVSGAASFLAIAALAVAFDDGFASRFVTNRAALTSAGIEVAHLLLSFIMGLRVQAAVPALSLGFAKTSSG